MTIHIWKTIFYNLYQNLIDIFQRIVIFISYGYRIVFYHFLVSVQPSRPSLAPIGLALALPSKSKIWLKRVSKDKRSILD